MSDLPREEQPLSTIYPGLDIHSPIPVEILPLDEVTSATQSSRAEDATLNEFPPVVASKTTAFGVPVKMGGSKLRPTVKQIRSTIPNSRMLALSSETTTNYTSTQSTYIRPSPNLELYEPFVDIMPCIKMNFSELFASIGDRDVEYDLDDQDAAILGHILVRFGVALDAHQFEMTMQMLNVCAASILMRMSLYESINGLKKDTTENEYCMVCNSGDFHDSNSILFCDGCDIAVHQECYGVPTIPEGFWFCRKCEALREYGHTLKVKCELCPIISGAFKPTSNNKWVHMVCALYMPTVRVPKETGLLEPIHNVERVEHRRYTLKCYICNEKRGACLQCTMRGCFKSFHASCARLAGLYMYSYNNDMSDILVHQDSLPVYCDKHSHAMRVSHPDRSVFIIDGVNKVRELIREEREKQKTRGPSIFAKPRLANIYWRTPIFNTLVLPQEVVEPVRRELKKRFDIDVSTSLVEFMCRYWTVKKDMLDGVMLNRRLNMAVETATIRLSKPMEAENLEESPENMLKTVEQLMGLIKMFKAHPPASHINSDLVQKSLVLSASAPDPSSMSEKTATSEPIQDYTSELSAAGPAANQSTAHNSSDCSLSENRTMAGRVAHVARTAAATTARLAKIAAARAAFTFSGVSPHSVEEIAPQIESKSVGASRTARATAVRLARAATAREEREKAKLKRQNALRSSRQRSKSEELRNSRSDIPVSDEIIETSATNQSVKQITVEEEKESQPHTEPLDQHQKRSIQEPDTTHKILGRFKPSRRRTERQIEAQKKLLIEKKRKEAQHASRRRIQQKNNIRNSSRKRSSRSNIVYK